MAHLRFSSYADLILSTRARFGTSALWAEHSGLILVDA